MSRHPVPLLRRAAALAAAAALAPAAVLAADNADKIARVGAPDAQAALVTADWLAVAQPTLTAGLAGLQSSVTFASNIPALRLSATPGSVVTGLEWNFSLNALPGSKLSDAMIRVTSVDGRGVALNAGLGLDTDGTATLSGAADLVSMGKQFIVPNSGLLLVLLYELNDDRTGPDAIYTSGSLQVQTYTLTSPVPEPAGYGMLALGLAVVGLAARRRPRH